MLWGSNFRAGWQLRGTREWCVIPYLSLLIWNPSSLSGVGKKELLPLFVLLKLSDTAISLGAEQNSAGGRQSQPLTVSAIVALAEYKGADQRRKSSRHIFSLCSGDASGGKFDCSHVRVWRENTWRYAGAVIFTSRLWSSSAQAEAWRGRSWLHVRWNSSPWSVWATRANAAGVYMCYCG